MNKPEGNTNQWHSTSKLVEGDMVSFFKEYEPNSYEVKNELGWLCSALIRECKSIRVPGVKEASVEKGYIKMDFIESEEGKPKEEILEYLVHTAAELHSLIKSKEPRLRQNVPKSEYNSFLHTYTQKRLDALDGSEYALDLQTQQWILDRVDSLRTEFFTVVHRDMRMRHLLFPRDDEKARPALVDWEFSNISEPAQDVAKIIYDAVTQGMNVQEVKKKVLDLYAYLTKKSVDELTEKVDVFLPIIPLERDMSLMHRKPPGYEAEILRDLVFIRTLYEESK